MMMNNNEAATTTTTTTNTMDHHVRFSSHCKNQNDFGLARWLALELIVHNRAAVNPRESKPILK